MERRVGWAKRTEAEWIAIIEKQRQSGQTGAGYCRSQGIDYEQYLYHRWKILGKKRSGRMMAPSSMVPATASSRSFIPITVDGCSSVRIRFPRGMIVESDRLPEAAWLVEVAARWIGVEPC